MSQSPTLNDVVDDAIDTRLDNFWTAVPASVLSFDSASRRASIRILLANAVEDGAGEKRWYHPMVYNVPVVFPWGTSTSDGKGYGITFPFGDGDTGLYVVSTLATHGWQSNGSNAGNLDEDRGSRNNIAHGFLIPTIHAGKDVPVPVEQNALVLHGDKVKIGGPTGTEPTLMADTFMKHFNNFLNTLTAELNAFSGGSLGTTIAAAFQTLGVSSTAPAGVKTSKTEVK